MPQPESRWKTAITHIAPNRVAVRGYDIAGLMGTSSFGEAVFLLLRGELPGEGVGRLMDAILVSSIDHGPTPPSVLAARTVASTGASLSQAAAAGVLAINKYHGGAIEDCARQLRRIAERADLQNESLEGATKAELAEMKARGERMSGFGHRIHTSDPRTARLFELAAAAGVNGPHMKAARAVETVFKGPGGPSLPMNVDGAIAAILGDLGFEPRAMNGLFMIARLPGLIAHALEEQAREKPMRVVDPVNHEYDGPTR